MRIYTRGGDEGTTGLFYGGRAWKDDPGPEAYGSVDEAVAALGVARSLAEGELHDEILAVQRELFVLAAELATAPENRPKLEPGVSLVTEDMVAALEQRIDRRVEASGLPTEFVVPGQTGLEAALDAARTVIRRAERRTVGLARAGGLPGGHAVAYLNRLADYVYVLARGAAPDWQPSRPHREERA